MHHSELSAVLITVFYMLYTEGYISDILRLGFKLMICVIKDIAWSHYLGEFNQIVLKEFNAKNRIEVNRSIVAQEQKTERNKIFVYIR